MIARRALTLATLAAVALGGCSKRDAAATLDAGADARARTAAKTLADLDAADRAGATALPRAAAAPPAPAAPRRMPTAADDRAADNTADPNL